MRAALQRREPAALEVFFDTYFSRVYAYVRRMVDSVEEAEDVTQEVFLRLHDRIGTYDGERDPRPWVFAVASNVLRSWWRRR